MSNEKEVYVVLYESVYDGEFDTKVTLFDNEDAALELFRDTISEFKDNDSLADSEDLVEERSEFENGRSYSAYEDGNYAENHLCVSVMLQPVYSNSTDNRGFKEPFND